MTDIDKTRWLAAAPYLDEALLIEPAALREWLSALATREPAIAADVRALLQMRDDASFAGFLGENPVGKLPAAAERTGRSIGPYVLDQEIGRGGMGTVWSANRADGRFKGRVAIKFVNTLLSGAQGEQRFLREGGVLGRLNHPHIARLLDAGVDGHQPYLVLEYVDGLRIDRYCDERGLDIRARLRLFVNVVDAVAHAHQHLVIHRDIKPGNVLVTVEGAVKLLDFGVAKLLGDDADDAALTRDAAAAFTPGFAAPEQLRGQPVTTATDVYSLGMLLYLLLAGRHPLIAPGDTGPDLLKLRDGLTPARPSQLLDETRGEAQALTDIAASRATTGDRLIRALRGDVDNIVTKALSGDAAERYPSAGALRDDLLRYLAHEPVTARPATVGYRARKFFRRHRGGVLAGVTAGLALIGLTVFALLQMNEARAQRDEAQFQAKRAQAESQFVNLMISEVGDSEAPLTLERILDKGVDLLGERYQDDPEFAAGMFIRMSGRYMDLGLRKKEHAALIRAETLARQVGDPLLLARVQCNTVETEIALDDLDAAQRRIAEGQAALNRVTGPAMSQRVDCLHAEASLAEARDEHDRALQLALQAMNMLEEARHTETSQYSGLLSHIEVMYLRSDRPREAMDINTKAQAAINRSGRGDSAAALSAKHNAAFTLANLGEIRAALAAEREVIDRTRTSDPKAFIDPSTSALYGDLLLRMQLPAEALTWLEDSARELDAIGNLPNATVVRANRARALLRLQRLDEALETLPDIAALEGNTSGAAARGRATVGIAHAELLLAAGKPAEARARILPVVESAREAGPRGAQQFRLALLVASRVALAEQRHDVAERTALEALKAYEEKSRGETSSAHVGEALLLLSRARHALGKAAQANEALERAVACFEAGYGPDHPTTLQARDLLAVILSAR